MLHRVALVRTDVLEELSASFIRVTRIGELGTTLAVTSNRRTLWRNIMILLTFLAHQFLSPWWWRRYVPPKRRFLHSISSQRASVASYCYRSYLTYSCHPYNGGNTFLRNVCSYKSHDITSLKMRVFIVTAVKPSNHYTEMGLGGVDCIYVAQDTDKWLVLVNAVMELRIP
jgi:hypothetical protein